MRVILRLMEGMDMDIGVVSIIVLTIVQDSYSGIGASEAIVDSIHIQFIFSSYSVHIQFIFSPYSAYIQFIFSSYLIYIQLTCYFTSNQYIYGMIYVQCTYH